MNESGEYFCIEFHNDTTFVDINRHFLQRHIPSLIFLSMCFVAGLAGNVLVLIVYHRKFKTSNYKLYVLFLAYIDTVFCLTTLPFYFLNILFRYSFVWDVVCRIGCFLTIFLSLASLVILVIVAIDRYIVVQKPMRSKLSEAHAIKGCIAAIVLSGILSWYSILLYGVRKEVVFEAIVSTCAHTHKLSIINAYVLLSCSILLSSFFGVTYGGIWSKIKASARRSSASHNTRAKTIVIYIAITTIFSVTTMVSICLNIFKEFVKTPLNCRIGGIGESAFMFFSLAHCLNHVVNPFIYYWRDKKFQKNVLHLVRSCSRSEETGDLEKDSEKSSTSKKGSYSYSVESMSRTGNVRV